MTYTTFKNPNGKYCVGRISKEVLVAIISRYDKKKDADAITRKMNKMDD